jgi:hypothetical protein
VRAQWDGAMWYVTRHVPLQGGVRGPKGFRELAEADTSGCGTERRGGIVEGLPVLEHVASDVHSARQSASRSLLR